MRNGQVRLGIRLRRASLSCTVVTLPMRFIYPTVLRVFGLRALLAGPTVPRGAEIPILRHRVACSSEPGICPFSDVTTRSAATACSSPTL